MLTVQEAERPEAPHRPVAEAAAAAIFLHAGWRSCGTWLWEALRDSHAVRAYYEPLHEDLDRLDSAALNRFSPASWDSGHSPGAPYFAEYAGRLRAGGRGIAGYAPRFAFDDFFRDPADDDPALHAYLLGLVESARLEGRLPVLKFCRSLGRVPWLARRFPDALHAVVLRDPIDQFLSARYQMERAKNRYFVLAPFLILARNASHPLLADALARLDVPMPPHLSRDPGVTTQVCWHHVKRLNWAERYRGFLALWAATAVTALRADVMVIDAEELALMPAHRAAVEHRLRQASGVALSLNPGRGAFGGSAWPGSKAEANDAVRSAFAALDFVHAWRGALAPAHTRRLARRLVPRLPAADVAVLTRAHLPAPVPPRRRLPASLGQLDAAAYVVAARLSYPLRRTHFHYRRMFPKSP